MKSLAFVLALVVMAFGALAILMPSSLEGIAHHMVTVRAWCLVAAIRIAVGLLLIRVASGSRAPRAIRVLGYVILIAGVATAVMALAAMDRARDVVEWWLRQGTGVFRIAGVVVLGLGSFIAYACAPARH